MVSDGLRGFNFLRSISDWAGTFCGEIWAVLKIREEGKEHTLNNFCTFLLDPGCCWVRRTVQNDHTVAR